MRVVVAGSRYQQDRKFVYRVLDELHARFHFTRLATGACRGTDQLAHDWAVANGIKVVEYPPEWEKYGRRAGPLRNATMLDEERPRVVVAFPGGSGTTDLVRRALAWRKSQLEVVEVGKEPAAGGKNG